MSSQQRVVITGVGPLCALGDNKKQIWDSIIEKRTNVVKHSIGVDGESWEEFYIHKLVKYDLSSVLPDLGALQWIREWKEGQTDIDFELMAMVTGLALRDSSLDVHNIGEKIGLMLVHENPGLEPLIEHLTDKTIEAVRARLTANKPLNVLGIKKEVTELSQRIGYDTQTFMHLYFVAKLFGIKGYSLFSNNACSSGLFAFESAAQHIRSGRLKAAVVAGSDWQSYVYKYLWFKKLNIYSEDGLVRPFSKNSNGMVFGEGGGALVLEEYEHAKARGANIYCEYVGGGFGMEGMKISFPSVGSPAYAQCVKAAIAEAKTDPSRIDWVVPHGIGEKVTDAHEAKQIKDVFGVTNTPVCTAFKTYVGHNLGSCGLLELSLACIAMSQNTIPATLNTDATSSLSLSSTHLNKPITQLLKTSCGFAGFNAAVILRRIHD